MAILISPSVLRPLFWIMGLFALFMALIPHPPALHVFEGDKIQHMAAFASLTVVARLGWRDLHWSRILIGLSLFGVAIELLQALPIIHRDCQFSDWVADTLAILVALPLATWATRRWPIPEPAL